MADTNLGAERVRRRRERMRQAGLRPMQIWVPDTRAAGFDEECARQAKLVAQADTPESLAEDLLWFDGSDKTGWTS